MRIPFPWEGQPDPLEGAGDVDHADLVVMPPQPDVRSQLGAGELTTSVSPRDTREQMYRQILDHTDGTPAARKWAREKADTACRNWDRGVRTGSITKH